MREFKLLIILFVALFVNQSAAQTINIISTPKPQIMGSWLTDFFIDDQGVYYVGAVSGEVGILRNNEWELIDVDPTSVKGVSSVITDDNGSIWAGTSEGLYEVKDGSTINHFTAENSSLVSNSISDLLFAQGKLWIGFNDDFGNKGFMTLENGSWDHFTEQNSFLIDGQVRSFDLLSDGSVLANNGDEIYIISSSGTAEAFDIFDELRFGTIVADIHETENGDILLATNKGMAKYIRASNEIIDLNDIYEEFWYEEVFQEPTGEVWLSEFGQGIHYFDKNGKGTFFGVFDHDLAFEYDEMIWYDDSLRVLGNTVDRVWTMTVEGVTSTTELSKDAFNLFPNPVLDQLNLLPTEGSQLSYKMMSIDGSLTKSGVSGTIDCSDLQSGVYLLEIKDVLSGDTRIEKVVKK